MPYAPYVYLPVEQLQIVQLVHLISGLDEDHPALAGNGACPTAITGYTEWISTEDPQLTLGWDWEMHGGGRSAALSMVGEPRSNVMLRQAGAVNLGHQRSAALLKEWISGYNWQLGTLQHITARYQS